MKIIYKDGHVAECPAEEELHVLRHSAAHIMAQAIKRLFPEADFAFGPATQNGFYYDVDLGERKLTPEDLEAIEKEMKKIVKENLPFKAFVLPREDAKKLMAERGENYKLEHMDDLADETEFSFFQQGEYIDMCLGPHLLYTKALKAFKITQQSGAYWKDDSNNKMLTRINGVAFRTQQELDDYLVMLEEAKKRDHRKLGRELGLFAFRDEAPGFPFYLPKGMVLRNTLIDYWREVHKKWDYVEISTPQIMRRTLWETSGHWDHYKDNMYTTVIDGEDFAIKPMNCPGTILVYDLEPHSYRDLPMRCAELGNVHRHELSGALHGMFRVRAFTQDDAHILLATSCWPRSRSRTRSSASPSSSTRSTPSSACPTRSSCPPCPRTTSAPWRTGTSPPPPSPTPSPASARSISSTPATAPSTARSLTSTSRTASGAPGSAVPSSSTTSCPAASI